MASQDDENVLMDERNSTSSRKEQQETGYVNRNDDLEDKAFNTEDGGKPMSLGEDQGDAKNVAFEEDDNDEGSAQAILDSIITRAAEAEESAKAMTMSKLSDSDNSSDDYVPSDASEAALMEDLPKHSQFLGWKW
ncbi:hypothetical protein BC829DRAFT_62774 [Chytridium lagenaria]|nr:hypothetical protein BC829DRAFT_62774 [Chytridium lagenaria]